MGFVVVIIAAVLTVGALVDIWRWSEEPTLARWGWSIAALVGQFTLPGWRLGNGWYAAIPIGAVIFLTLARSGPLRRAGSS